MVAVVENESGPAAFLVGTLAGSFAAEEDATSFEGDDGCCGSCRGASC